MAIQSFGDSTTEEFFFSGQLPSKGCGWKRQSKVVARKLDMLEAATDVTDLRIPPSNRLEKLSGDRKEWHSIRINAQWRIVFVWTEDGPTHVQVVDYH